MALNKIPEQITLAYLTVLVMPNGEILCEGKTLGWLPQFHKYLHHLKDGVTSEPIPDDDPNEQWGGK